MLRKTGQTEEGELVLHKPLFNAEREDCWGDTCSPVRGDTGPEKPGWDLSPPPGVNGSTGSPFWFRRKADVRALGSQPVDTCLAVSVAHAPWSLTLHSTESPPQIPVVSAGTSVN